MLFRSPSGEGQGVLLPGPETGSLYVPLKEETAGQVLARLQSPDGPLQGQPARVAALNTGKVWVLTGADIDGTPEAGMKFSSISRFISTPSGAWLMWGDLEPSGLMVVYRDSTGPVKSFKMVSDSGMDVFLYNRTGLLAAVGGRVFGDLARELGVEGWEYGIHGAADFRGRAMGEGFIRLGKEEGGSYLLGVRKGKGLLLGPFKSVSVDQNEPVNVIRWNYKGQDKPKGQFFYGSSSLSVREAEAGGMFAGTMAGVPDGNFRDLDVLFALPDSWLGWGIGLDGQLSFVGPLVRGTPLEGKKYAPPASGSRLSFARDINGRWLAAFETAAGPVVVGTMPAAVKALSGREGVELLKVEGDKWLAYVRGTGEFLGPIAEEFKLPGLSGKMTYQFVDTTVPGTWILAVILPGKNSGSVRKEAQSWYYGPGARGGRYANCPWFVGPAINGHEFLPAAEALGRHLGLEKAPVSRATALVRRNLAAGGATGLDIAVRYLLDEPSRVFMGQIDSRVLRAAIVSAPDGKLLTLLQLMLPPSGDVFLGKGEEVIIQGLFDRYKNKIGRAHV